MKVLIEISELYHPTPSTRPHPICKLALSRSPTHWSSYVRLALDPEGMLHGNGQYLISFDFIEEISLKMNDKKKKLNLNCLQGLLAPAKGFCAIGAC